MKRYQTNQSIYVLLFIWNQQLESNDEVKETDIKAIKQFMSSSLSGTNNKSPMMKAKKIEN
jgi:hypothetical protein